MPERIHAPAVGSPVPDLNTSPIIEETADDYETLGTATPEDNLCYFNNIAYPNGQFVCSGDELLRCIAGGWLREGSCDPDNP